jgi:bile acid-coenzyme A ligase
MYARTGVLPPSLGITRSRRCYKWRRPRDTTTGRCTEGEDEMASVVPTEGVPYGTQIRLLAEANPDGCAVIFAAEDGTERRVTWRELDERSTQLAHVFADHGLALGDFLAVCLRNSPEHLMACFAGWKLGAVVVPMRWDLPEWEKERIMATIRPTLAIDADNLEHFAASRVASAAPLKEVVPPHGWGVCSSGSTGSPKVIVMNIPGLYSSEVAPNPVVESYVTLAQPQRVLVPAPLYHTNGFTALRHLLAGQTIVLLERFNAPRILDLIERHRISGFVGATLMLQRLAQVPDIDERDLSSLDWVQQGASPLPVWLGRRWCELVGPERFYLSYGASEGHGLIICRGDQWLAHPGCLGLPAMGAEVKVLDGEGQELPPGEIGGIYMRTPTGPVASYKGDDASPMTRTDDGFVTVGDLGWTDNDGYVYLADRRVDMIVTGGANVFPAEVESALSEYPQIRDVVVIGLRDPEWGRRVHAIIQPADVANPPDVAEVISFVKARLAPYKAPKTVEFVDSLPRNDAMKLNRGALVLERDGPEPATEPPGRAIATV